MYTPENFESKDTKTWVEFAKKHKDFFVNTTARGDVPPTIIAERNGKVFAVAMAPEMDKTMAFGASHLLRAGAGADALVLILDAHVRKGDKTDEFMKNYKHGDMQRACDEEGACEAGLISDCLICHRIDEDGKITMKILEYSYHGKGTEFKWKDSDDLEKIMDRVDGLIPETLRKIMSEKPFIDRGIMKKMSNDFNFDEERSQYHAARAVFHLLIEKGFSLCDFVSFKHPEWCGAADKLEKIVLSMSEEGVLPKIIVPRLARIISDHIGKISFAEEVAQVIEKYKDRFDAKHKEIPQNPKIFADWLHQQAFVPTGPKMSIEKEPPFRVKVWSGDKSQYLGEGKCVEFVNVYLAKDEGYFATGFSPEVKPEGFSDDDILELSDNPKIILDNGEIVYGFQVWFEVVEEEVTHPDQIKVSWPGEQ